MNTQSTEPNFIVNNKNIDLLADTISPAQPAVQLRIAHINLSHFEALSQEAARVIASILEKIAPRSERYRVYLLSNKDIVCIFTGLKIQGFRNEVLAVLRRAKVPDVLQTPNIYGLTQTLSLVEFRSNVLRLASYAESLIEAVKTMRGAEETHDSQSQGKKIDIQSYAKLVSQFSQIDLTTFMRFRSIVDIHRSEAHTEDSELYSEVSADIDDIVGRVVANVDFELTPWLYQDWKSNIAQSTFKYLAREITKLTANRLGFFLPLQLLNSKSFLTLCEQLPINMRGRVVLELDFIDFVSNHQKHMLEIEELLEKKFLLCIDHVPVDMFAQLDFSDIPVHYIKVSWPGRTAHWNDQFCTEFKNKMSSLQQRVGLIASDIQNFSALIDAVQFGFTNLEGRVVSVMQSRNLPIHEHVNNALNKNVKNLEA